MNELEISNEESIADDLTWREQDILILLAEHLTNREIADRLHLAESTVKDYVGKILSKLYVKNRRQAVERAKSLGLLDIDQKTTITPTVNLPPDPTPFVGRVDELSEIQRLMAHTHLLTLTGPGGIGKTRLAIRAAAEMAVDFDHGTFFVSLAPIHSADHLIQTIAEGLKFPLATHEDPQVQLLRYMQNRQMLLVMDNFEHLLDGAGIVSQILLTAPGVKVLATSRERLNLQSETLLNISGMVFPYQEGKADTLDYDSVTLFIQSASKVRPGYKPAQDELEQISSICQIVQGMPLAIELAAAWLHVLNVDEIAGELEKGLDILATDVRDAPERHRSIQNVFDYSWSMLQAAEREIFLRLSIFRGGFTREAAGQVTGASLPQLATLVNKSFISLEAESGRFKIHELLRQFAQERLAKRPLDYLEVKQTHAAYFAQFMHQRWEDLKGRRQIQALLEIESDIENVRAAWRFYVDQSSAAQMRMFIKSLWQVYWIRGWNHAGMELFARAANALQGREDEQSSAVRALAMAFQGYFMAWLDLAEPGLALGEESAAILQQLDHPEALLFAHDTVGVNAYMLGQYQDEVTAADKMLHIARQLNDKWFLAFSLFAVGMGALLRKDYTGARQLAESSLQINDDTGDVIGSCMSMLVAGHAALAAGEFEDACKLYQRCLKISEGVGFYYGMQNATKYLGKVTLSMGDLTEAEYYLHRCLSMTKDIGFVRDIVNLCYEFARLRAAQGNLESAVEILAFVIQHPASQLTRMHEGRIRDSARDLLAGLETELPPETCAAALERGQALDLDEVVPDLVGPKHRR